jgi:UPF0755 protein
MKKKAFIFLVLLAPLVGLSLASVHLWLIAKTPYEGENQTFVIEPGDGFARINYNLAKNGFIPDAKIFYYYAKYKKSLSLFKTGHYLIQNKMTMFDVHAMLTEGRSQLTKVTIPEGKNLFQIAQILESKGILSATEFIKLANNPETASRFDITGPNIEGYLFPETYYFSPKSRPIDVIKAMVNEFKKQTKQIEFSYGKLNKQEIVTLASIVEKETGAKFERSKIAGVFHNRLKKRMRLQSDPTTIYGIYEHFDGNLKRRHLREKTPYNTYAISGLPVGPISNPGLDAIKAVLKPESHQYLYFVSRNNGTHVFSKTYKEHDKAVDYYQRIKANREGRSWRDLKQ